MKRILFLIGVLLLSHVMRAQSVSYACRYWFDQDQGQMVMASASDNLLQMELDASSLSPGIHLLFIQVKDSTGVWCPPQHYMFYKPLMEQPVNMDNVVYHCWFDEDTEHMQSGLLGTGLFLLNADDLDEGLHLLYLNLESSSLTTTKSYMFYKAFTEQPASMDDVVYHCWFDEDTEHIQSGSLGTGQFLLNADDLAEGLHLLYVNLENSSLTTTKSYMFYKAFTEQPVNMDDVVYHCWFDEDTEHIQSGLLGTGQFLLNADDLTEGLHLLYVNLESSSLTTTKSYMFYKAFTEQPASMDNVVYHCWFDHDYSTVQTGSLGNGIFELDTEALTGGIHILNVQLDNGTLAAPQHYMFYKKLEREQIARWEYWLNDDVNNRHTTNFSPCLDSLSIISLLPVETQPVRSTCFHFHPNGDEPYLNAKNKITFKFWSTQRHFIEESRYYIDENVVEPIVADTLERNTTVSIAAPRDNQIHWFKLAANRGDYLTFQANKACTMQLFAPSGDEIYSASGPESLQETGFNVWEDGAFYLAVHDANGSEDSISITYNWFYRFAVLAYDVHLVGNGGCSTITFQGNGFNSLLDVYLVNAQNDTIRQLDIGHESNTTTTVSWNFYQENLGVYDAVFEFYEETIRINGALEVQEPVDIVLTSTVSYPSAFLRNTPCTYTFTITNEGNMTAYNVPLYVYIGTEDMNGLYSIHIDGIEIQSFYDCVKDIYEWSELEKRNLKEYSDLVGVDHCFVKSVDIGDNGVDSVLIRSGNFYLEIPPYTTRTISLKLTSYTNVDTWFTYPNEWLPIIEQENQWFFFDSLNRSSRSDFCCWHTTAENVLNGLSIISSGASIVLHMKAAADLGTSAVLGATALIPNPTSPSAVALAGAGVMSAATVESLSLFASFSSCALSSLAEAVYETANDLCNGGLTTGDKVISVSAILTDCLDSFLSVFFPSLGYVSSISSIGKGAWSIWHNLRNKNPYCDNGESNGGKSNAVAALDPNNIRGYLSESGSHYMRQEIQNIHYEIEFENDTTLATAAAHTIIVRDTLDATKFDLNSLAARSVTIGDKRLELEGEQSFVRTLDMRPELYVIAQINQDYDPETGIVEWTIQSLDPMTMEPIVDPNLGVLPVNYFGDGVGFIDYSINLNHAFDDGTEISNRAGIIFDQNDVIMTPTWTNTVDAVKPTSHIEEVTPVADSLSFSIVSEDNRSGVWYHILYYRNDSTQMQWQVKKPQIFEDSFVLHLEDLLTTEYLVIAVDSAGNREDKDMVAEYIYTASGLHFVTEGNWSTASNWQEGTLPEADDVAFISAPCQLDQDAEVAALAISDDQTLTVQSGKTLTVNGLLFNPSAEGLVIEDGAQLINATSNVAATMEKGIAAYPSSGPDGWYTIASPMDEMPIAESDFLTPNFDLYRFDETNLTHEEWQNYKANHPDFATFEKGRGYLYANSNSFAPAFMGTLSNTAATYHLTYTERPDALSGFNLIGNPFPHVIYKGAGGAIDNAQLASGYYTLTNEGAWHVHTYEDAIMPGQGILVKTMAGLDLTIAKSNATALSESSDAKASSSRVVLKVSGSWGEDRAFVYFGQGIGLDKMENLSRSVPSLWIRDNGHDYAIAHVDSDCESLELFFSNMQSGDFTLSVDVSDTSFSVLQLTDRITGVTIDLLQQPSYVFHSAGQENEARFSLTFKMETMR